MGVILVVQDVACGLAAGACPHYCCSDAMKDGELLLVCIGEWPTMRAFPYTNQQKFSVLRYLHKLPPASLRMDDIRTVEHRDPLDVRLSFCFLRI